jgi:D-alanyl-D-alanine dipeptidase
MTLVDIRSINPNILVDLRYACENNFTGKKVYDFEQCLLLPQVASNLDNVQKELELVGLGIKIWDGYRPISAQWKFWELMPDERYVSDPRKGGRHTRGTAVDLTLVNKEGIELLMPTLFDDFSSKAHRECEDLPIEAIEHRDFLREVMEAHGFSGIETEWWHYDLVGWEQFPLI